MAWSASKTVDRLQNGSDGQELRRSTWRPLIYIGEMSALVERVRFIPVGEKRNDIETTYTTIGQYLRTCIELSLGGRDWCCLPNSDAELTLETAQLQL